MPGYVCGGRPAALAAYRGHSTAVCQGGTWLRIFGANEVINLYAGVSQCFFADIIILTVARLYSTSKPMKQ